MHWRQRASGADRERGLALIVLHRELKFITITEAVHGRIITGQSDALRSRDDKGLSCATRRRARSSQPASSSGLAMRRLTRLRFRRARCWEKRKNLRPYTGTTS